LLAYVAISSGQANSAWVNSLLYTGGSCGAAANYQYSFQSPVCTGSGCTVLSGVAASTSCSGLGGAPPALISGTALYAYSSANCAAGTETALEIVTNAAGCVAYQGKSYTASCAGTVCSFQYWSNSTTCFGAPQESASNVVGNYTLGTCATNVPGFNLPGTGFKFVCAVASSSTCFHEDVEITYKNKKYTKATLKTIPEECAIPHEPFTNGVAITTDCNAKPLRLTADHLVFTQRGLIAAGSVVRGDVVYSKEDRTTTCKVLSNKVDNSQHYFGLNCRSSEVLADGILTSTFGKYHSVPSMWMKLASAVVGVQRASQFGDSLATLASKLNLL